ncbi:flagellar hook-associated protein FlgL [Desulfovibrio sp. OttesenSCG-928-O18]|nr:flagellar hook-associated protein FlgL [Desulfovibrio sp. OttesenSCG-928-O18]
MRISQRQMFSTHLNHMNTSLSQLMESNNQGGTGKRINRPSDDPAGMARVMMYRNSLGNIDRHKSNIKEASGWLNLADNTLVQVSEVIALVKALDLQGSTGTVNGDNREQIAQQLRGYLGQFLNLANTEYNGQHIFAGHKVEEAAFVQGLGVTCNDKALDTGDFVVQGGADYTTTIQFTQSGDLKNGDTPNFVYSRDGGKTWEQGQWVSGKMMAGGTEISMYPPSDPTEYANWGVITGVPEPVTLPDGNPNDKESAGGTWLYVRPAVVYQGDSNKIETVQKYGFAMNNTVQADGHFTRDVTVRIDDTSGDIKYSYSLDNGSTWQQATAPAGSEQLAVPGGFLKINVPPLAGPTDAFADGQQFVVHPHRADINFDISNGQTITVNMVGKDIFGGLFQEPFAPYPTVVEGPNLFETMGRLIGFAESNDQSGVSTCLDELDECLKQITTRATEVGARENRLEVAFESLSMRELSEYDAMSAIEDVDTVTLMTKLAQQQLAYNTVLKSTSMVMQMSLMNFI